MPVCLFFIYIFKTWLIFIAHYLLRLRLCQKGSCTARLSESLNNWCANVRMRLNMRRGFVCGPFTYYIVILSITFIYVRITHALFLSLARFWVSLDSKYFTSINIHSMTDGYFFFSSWPWLFWVLYWLRLHVSYFVSFISLIVKIIKIIWSQIWNLENVMWNIGVDRHGTRINTIHARRSNIACV